MSRSRSISYAPWPAEDRQNAAEPGRPHPPEWILCRKFKELPLQDNSMLRRWAAEGRVLPDDYLVHQGLDLCVQAKDVAELGPILLRARARRARLLVLTLGLVAAMLATVDPVLGGAALVVDAVLAVRVVRTAVQHNDRYQYRLSSTGEHGVTVRPSRAAGISILKPA